MKTEHIVLKRLLGRHIFTRNQQNIFLNVYSIRNNFNTHFSFRVSAKYEC
jgi:hypothetical protein